jgi:predicted RNA-binding protein YlqC (UPF0109 family)
MQVAEAAEKLSAFLIETVRMMVELPDLVRVTGKLDGAKLTLVLDVAPRDRGYVIGKEGRAARSLATIVKASGTRMGVQVDLDVVGRDRVEQW